MDKEDEKESKEESNRMQFWGEFKKGGRGREGQRG